MDAVLNRLERGMDVAFITIGDPSIYSTFFYLYDRLLEKLPSLVIEMVPGISSINASAARAGLSLGLGDERIASCRRTTWTTCRRRWRSSTRWYS